VENIIIILIIEITVIIDQSNINVEAFRALTILAAVPKVLGFEPPGFDFPPFA
jgi:hypothetical protein